MQKLIFWTELECKMKKCYIRVDQPKKWKPNRRHCAWSVWPGWVAHSEKWSKAKWHHNACICNIAQPQCKCSVRGLILCSAVTRVAANWGERAPRALHSWCSRKKHQLTFLCWLVCVERWRDLYSFHVPITFQLNECVESKLICSTKENITYIIKFKSA